MISPGLSASYFIEPGLPTGPATGRAASRRWPSRRPCCSTCPHFAPTRRRRCEKVVPDFDASLMHTTLASSAGDRHRRSTLRARGGVPTSTTARSRERRGRCRVRLVVGVRRLLRRQRVAKVGLRTRVLRPRRAPRNCGMAIAIKMAMINTTTINSMRVNPSSASRRREMKERIDCTWLAPFLRS